MSALHIARRGDIAKPTAFDPSTVSGLRDWWDPNAITGLSDGDPIASVSDSGPSGRSLTQATSSKRPTYKTAIQNGKPVMRFDGVDDFLDTPSFTQTQPFTVAWAVIPRALNNVSWSLFDGSNVKITHIANLAAWRVDAGTGVQVPGTGPVAGTPEIDVFVFTGSSSALWRNGVSSGSINIGTGGVNGGFRLASDKTGANSHQVDLGDVLFYSGAMGSTDITALTRYLGAKYAITVA